MLFDKKNKKRFQIAWAILGVLIIISMVIMYIPGLVF